MYRKSLVSFSNFKYLQTFYKFEDKYRKEILKEI